MIADALERLEHEGRLHRHVDVLRVLHRAGDQAAHPGRVLGIELLVARDDLGRRPGIDPIERLERPPQKCQG